MDTRSIQLPSAGLYLHIPFCQSKCHYCAFYNEPVGSFPEDRLVQALLTELTTQGSLDTIHTVFLGGGSPTTLTPEQLARLLRGIREHCAAIDEFTIECNPCQVTPPLLETMIAGGVNRLSFGVQSFDDHDLLFLGRRHSADQAATAIKRARSAGCTNISIDLIFAIPGSTLETWQATLERTISFDMQHVSAYSLSYETGTRLERARRCGRVQPVDDGIDRGLYEQAIEKLYAAGFEHYEVSNFARPGFACQHNLGYWENRPYLGIGPAAASYWQGQRYENVANIAAYVEAVETGCQAWTDVTRPSTTDRICETAVLNLRTNAGINPARFAETTGADLWETFGSVIRRHAQDGLLRVRRDRVTLTPAAWPIANTVLCDFASL